MLIQKKLFEKWTENNIVFETTSSVQMQLLYTSYSKEMVDKQVLPLKPKTFALLLKQKLKPLAEQGRIKFCYRSKATVLGVNLINADYSKQVKYPKKQLIKSKFNVQRL